MSKFKVKMIYENCEEMLMSDDSYDNAVFDSYEDANYEGLEACSNYIAGAEVLHLSNPFDYPYDGENTYVDFEIIEVEDD